MDEYFVKSACEDCECKFAIILYHVCDKMDDPSHDTCTDECNPDEVLFIPCYDDKEKLATFLRCAEC